MFPRNRCGRRWRSRLGQRGRTASSSGAAASDHPSSNSGWAAIRSPSSDTPMLSMCWLNVVKRLRSGFGPTEKIENPSNSRNFFSLKSSAKRRRTQSEVSTPSFSRRKSAGLDQNDFPRGRHHKIVEADRAWHKHALTRAGRADAQPHDRIIRLRPGRTEAVGPLKSQPNFAPHGVGRSLPNRDEAWHQPACRLTRPRSPHSQNAIWNRSETPFAHDAGAMLTALLAAVAAAFGPVAIEFGGVAFRAASPAGPEGVAPARSLGRVQCENAEGVRARERLRGGL